jgi:hypothetical protein
LNAIKNSLNATKSKTLCNNCGSSTKNSGALKSVELALGGFEDIKLYKNRSDKIGSTISNESLSLSLLGDDIN